VIFSSTPSLSSPSVSPSRVRTSTYKLLTSLKNSKTQSHTLRSLRASTTLLSYSFPSSPEMDYSASQTEPVSTGVVTGSPLPSSLDTSASSPLSRQVISTSSPSPLPQQVISTSTVSSIPHPPPPPPVLGISQVYRAPPAAPNLGLRKVLVVLSSQSTLHLRNNKLQQTGTFLSELVRPLESILKSGFQPGSFLFLFFLFLFFLSFLTTLFFYSLRNSTW
jgi:hypothetical protein